MPPRSSSPICERSLDLTLIGIGRRDIPQCSPKHFLMQMFDRTFSGGQRPSGKKQRAWPLNGFQSVGSMILDETQNKLLVCDPAASRVSALTLADGKIKLLSNQVGAVTA